MWLMNYGSLLLSLYTLSLYFSLLQCFLFTLKPWPQKGTTKQLPTPPKIENIQPTLSGLDIPSLPVLTICYICSST